MERPAQHGRPHRRRRSRPFPQLRLAALECGHGWLPLWAARRDEHAQTCQHPITALKQKPSDYIRGPQYSQSIQLHEGEQSLRHVIEALGKDTLMAACCHRRFAARIPTARA